MGRVCCIVAIVLLGQSAYGQSASQGAPGGVCFATRSKRTESDSV